MEHERTFMSRIPESSQASQVTLGLTGGGTAGHVWPHLALFDSDDGVLRRAFDAGKLRVVYFGSHGGMEEGLVKQTMGAKWTFVALPAGKLRRYFSWRNVTDAFRVFAGFYQAVRVLRRERVNVVFSKGGFVAAPVVWAAWLLRLPVVIHESDVTPALATRLSLPFCQSVVCAFEATVHYIPVRHRLRVEALGLPIRPSLFRGDRAEARRFFGLDQDGQGLPVLLVFGGSLGAERLNVAIRESLQSLLERFEIIHIVGRGKEFEPAIPKGLAARYHQYAFLHAEMALAYAAADVAFTRAGASTLFELAAARIPMVLVPLGLDQSRGDQIVNAQVFERLGWAEVIREADLTSAQVMSTLARYGSSDAREAARLRLAAAPGPDAAERVALRLASYLWPRGTEAEQPAPPDVNSGGVPSKGVNQAT